MARTSEFVKSFGTAFEIFKALAQAVFAVGGNDEHLRHLLKDKKLVADVAKLIVDAQKKPSFPSAALAMEHGFEVVEDLENPTDFEVKNLKYISFLMAGEKVIDGNTMRSRSVMLKGNFGLCDAPRFLEQQADIPVEMQGKYIYFTATKLRRTDGCYYLACLCWSAAPERWLLRFYSLDSGWYDYDLLPCNK